jgi:carboxypeptidase Taq
MTEKIERLKMLLGEVSDISSAAAVLGWDQQVNMPPGGGPARAQQLSTLSTLSHKKFTSDEMGGAIEDAKAEVEGKDGDSDDVRLVKKTSHDFDKARKVTSEWVAEFSKLTSLGQNAWEKAREEDDFAQFQPTFEKIIEMRQAYADFFKPWDSVYDPLLDDYEQGMKASQVKAVFDELRPKQIELVRAISENGKPVDDAVLHLDWSEQGQWDFGVEVAKAIGFDFERGRQDKSVHPFTTSFSTGDVRITTRFDPKFLNTAIFSTMHEAGHGMYEQGTDPEFERLPIGGGASLAIHESQSRLWENLVGRDLPFWKAFYPRLKKIFPDNLKSIALEDFYRAINKVEPSLIRVEADEATYNLHIMLRFEMELDLLEGRLSAADAPEAWNAKFEEFLGLTPPSNKLGILQDVHWSVGYMGYFPTYALGNLVASQLWVKIKEDISDLEKQMEKGKFGDLLDWLRTNLHIHSSKYEPVELLKKITGSGLEAQPYIDYLNEKFGKVYEL